MSFTHEHVDSSHLFSVNWPSRLVPKHRQRVCDSFQGYALLKIYGHWTSGNPIVNDRAASSQEAVASNTPCLEERALWRNRGDTPICPGSMLVHHSEG